MQRHGRVGRRPWIVALVGIAASVAWWWGHVAAEERAIRANLELRATERALAVRHRVFDTLLAIEAVGTLFAGSREVTGDLFRAAARQLRARAPGIRSLSWNPRVTAEERVAHEAAARAEGIANYRITEGEPGSLRPAGERSVYYAARHIEPSAANETALGYDEASEPRRRLALERAAATGEPSLTTVLTFPQNAERRQGFFAFAPIYRWAPQGTSGPSRPDRLKGFVVGALQVADVVEDALGNFDVHFELRLLDVTEPERRVEIFAQPPPPDPASSGIVPEPGRYAAEALAQTASIDVGGRRWAFHFAPSEATLAAQRTYGPLRAFIGGLLATAALTAYIASLAGRARREERLVRERTRELREVREHLEESVAKRTAELAAANQDLTLEIEQRRQMEEALRQSEQRLRLTLDALSDGGWEWNLPRDELHLSGEWHASLGYALGDLMPTAKAWRDLIHPDDQAQLQEVTQGCLEGKSRRYECDVRVRAKSGTWRWTLVRGAIVERDEAGAPVRVVGAQTDIHERKRAEEERSRLEAKVREGQKLESLGLLAGGIAHDFNNLLVGILGNADLCLTKLPEDSQLRPGIEEIQLAAMTAAELAHQLLAYAGKASFAVERIDLSTVVKETAHLLRASISKNAELRFDLANELPPMRGDASQIRQVAMNLITNASDALGDGGGAVSLRTGVQDGAEDGFAPPHQTDAAAGPRVFLEVADRGIGMDEATLARIFDPFFTTKVRGRGLGLAAVLGIVRSHRGAIQLDSTPGRGTTVRVLFPSDSGGRALPACPETEVVLEGGTVLIVDDEPAVRNLARRILEDAGLGTFVAEGGSQALEIFSARAAEIDAVVLDLTMPEMSGREVMQALRRIRPDVRILVSSGWAEETFLEELGPERPDGCLGKPYRARALLSKLATVLAETGD